MRIDLQIVHPENFMTDKWRINMIENAIEHDIELLQQEVEVYE
jgi:hypothetical protein